MSQYGAGPLLGAFWSPFSLAQYGGMDWAYPFFYARIQHEEDGKRIIANASLLAYLAVLLVWLVFLSFSFSSSWLGSYASVTQVELAFFVLGLLPAALIYWLCYLLRFLQKADAYVRITLLGRILPVIIVLPLLPWIEQEKRLLVNFGAGWLLSCLALLYALYEVRRVGYWPFRFSYLDLKLSKEMLRYGLLLVPSSAAYALMVVTDRLLVGYFLGPDAVAVYAIAVSIGSLGVMFVGWFGLALDPYLSGWIASGNQGNYLPKMQLLVSSLAAFFAILSCLAAIWSAPVIELVYPEGYGPAAQLVPLIIFAAALTALSRLAVATAVIAQTPKFHTILYWFALVLNILAGWLLIPTLGVLGAVVSTVIAELAILSGWIYLGRIQLKNLKLSWRMPIVILLFTIIFVTVFLTQQSFNHHWLILIALSIGIVSVILLLLYRAIGISGMSTLHRYVRH